MSILVAESQSWFDVKYFKSEYCYSQGECLRYLKNRLYPRHIRKDSPCDNLGQEWTLLLWFVSATQNVFYLHIVDIFL